MREAKDTNDLKARAVEALRRAYWIETALDFESGALTAAGTLHRLREWKHLDSDDRTAIAALEALVAAERSASVEPAQATRASCSFEHDASARCSACTPSSDLAHATATIADLRAHVDALRADLATITSEGNAMQTTLDQIADAIGEPHGTPNLIAAVKRLERAHVEAASLRDVIDATYAALGVRYASEALPGVVRSVVANVAALREELRQAHAICAGSPSESAAEAVRRTRDRRDALDVELAAARAKSSALESSLSALARSHKELIAHVLTTAASPPGEFATDAVSRIVRERNAALEDAEALRAGTIELKSQRADRIRLFDALWDAVGGQREGESLVDAVRRVVSERDSEQRKRLNVQVNAQRMLFEQERATQGLPKPERVDAGQWWQLDGERGVFQYPARVLRIDGVWIDMETERSGKCSVKNAEMLTDPRWRYLGNGERAIEMNTKEASDVEQRRTGFDARTQWVSRAMTNADNGAQASDGAPLATDHAATISRTYSRVTITSPANWTQEDLWDELRTWPGFDRLLEAERQRTIDEAREAGRAEAKAEIERLRADLECAKQICARLNEDVERASQARDSYREERDEARSYVAAQDGEALTDAFRRAARETAGIAAARVAQERDAAYRSGQEEMRERAADHVHDDWGGGWSYTPANVAAAIRSLPIANAPAAPARTGEANPGGADAGAAGAGESVALREEVARLRYALGQTALSREEYAQDIARLNSEVEILKTSRDKARNERDCDNDALKAIESALLFAGVTPQADESLANSVRRALESRGSISASADRTPRIGDVVLLADTDDADDVSPAIIRNVRDDGKYDLWVAVPMAPFVYGAPRSRIRLRD